MWFSYGRGAFFGHVADIQVAHANFLEFRVLGPSKSRVFGAMLASKCRKMGLQKASKKMLKKG